MLRCDGIYSYCKFAAECDSEITENRSIFCGVNLMGGYFFVRFALKRVAISGHEQ